MVAIGRVREIFTDAREMLSQGRVRNAAETVWGVTDALLLAKTGEEPERGSRCWCPSIPWSGEPPSEALSQPLGLVQGECFYNGLCDPLEETEHRIR